MKKGRVTYHGLRPVSEAASTKMASIVFGKNLKPNSKTSFLYSTPPVADKDLPKAKRRGAKDQK
jgi:hypothetical protein